MSAKETAYNEIKKLVDKFGSQIDNYKSADYNETLTRRDFIDPFFEALGWDINNKQDVWESYREVIHEDKIKIGGSTKAPDYSFRLQGGNRLFFVEAKKPRVSIKDEFDPAYQIRLYGYNAGLPVSIVTDFEEFAVYDCRKKPKRGDKPSAARVEYFKYTDYLDKFDFIWDTFGREQVIKGGLVKYARAEKKGTATVDKDFLQSLDEWRTLLATNIYKNNTLTEDELNYAVQQTIDRLIFLRFAEDRGIEPYGQLKGCLNQANHYTDLFRLFNLADQRYNSGLFHFRKERDNATPEDTITGKLVIDNKTIKAIINGLYDNDYLFNVIPVEILGSAYEQFLGKQISIKGSKAVIEDKPEVRKAGGVYYTPQYIVDYIVKQTVGKLCDGKTPAQVSKLKIADPACGSGSFLLGAYQYLLNWHLDYYKQQGENPKKKSKVLTPDGSLTTQEKKRILLNNIYGVDIDSNAVEVTKLSLLLKCMEGETPASVGTQMTIVHERVLPSLEANIKSGNSLIDLDYYDGEIDFGGEKKIKPFNWQQSFPDVFKQAGFDAVIGNPPYSSKQSIENKQLLGQYKYIEYKCDPYAFFIERGCSILNKNGLLGYIIPVTWMTNVYYRKIRKFLIENKYIKRVNLIDGLVFQDANVDTSIIILSKINANRKSIIWQRGEIQNLETNEILRDYKQFKESDDYAISPESNNDWYNLKSKIDNISIKLSEIAKISLGMKLRSNDEFVVEKKSGYNVDPIIFGKDIGKYSKIIPYRFFNFANSVIIGGTKNKNIQQGVPKIFIQAIRNLSLKDRIVATLDTRGFYFIGTVNAVTINNNEYSYEYVLGLLNSKLLNTYFSKRFTTISLTSAFLGVLPICIITKDNEPLESQLIKLVNQMLQLNEELQAATVPGQQAQLKQRIQYTDNKINQIVYQLYNLTEEEIRIVEGN